MRKIPEKKGSKKMVDKVSAVKGLPQRYQHLGRHLQSYYRYWYLVDRAQHQNTGASLVLAISSSLSLLRQLTSLLLDYRPSSVRLHFLLSFIYDVPRSCLLPLLTCRQIFDANISLFWREGDPGGFTLFTPTGPRVLKFARLAIVVKFFYHLIFAVQSIPIVAIILRGFRGSGKIVIAGVQLFILVWFFMLLGREMFLYYGPDQGCNQCLACESKDATKVCTDQCSGLPYTGCSGYKTQADCNVNICKWVNTSSTCKFDRSKGGVCKANQADSYFSSTFSFDTNVNGLLLLSEIVIGSNW
eukprot:763329-Hanusia_phi.AAC.3